MQLLREVRCFADTQGTETPLNTWAGTSARDDLRMFWTLRATVRGPVDPRTGYLCDVKAIDQLLRGIAATRLSALPLAEAFETPLLTRAVRQAYADGAAGSPPPARLAALELKISPHTALSITEENPDMVHLTQSFEFAAAHRLSCEGLSEPENAALFGKCSNPHGHGHNYLLEVTVAGPVDERSGTVVNLPRLDRVVREHVIEPFDHKNLNIECLDFARLNPSVENIARVIFDRLKTAVRPARLVRVRVWETPRTCAECSADDRPD